MRNVSPITPWAAIVLCLGGLACGERTEITEIRPADSVAPPAPASRPSTVPSAEAAGLQWDVPSGWVAAEATPMRLVNFRVGAAQDAECYVSVLQGEAGGVIPNFERWRGQMGVQSAPLDEAGVAALPAITILGKAAPLLEVHGSYHGMDGEAHGGYMLLGTIGSHEGRSVFVKMIGPEATVQSQRDAFTAFCEGLR